jgi:hypothetical protein
LQLDRTHYNESDSVATGHEPIATRLLVATRGEQIATRLSYSCNWTRPSCNKGGCMTRARIRAPFDGKIILLKQRRNRNPRGGVSCLLASSSRMVVPLLTTTSRRSPPFTWCCTSGKACRSSSRPSLARRLALGQTAASPTSFPLEEPSHDKYPPRATSLRLA